MKRSLIVIMMLLFSCKPADNPSKQESEESFNTNETRIKKIAVINPAKDPLKLSMVKPVLEIIPSNGSVRTMAFHYKERNSFKSFKPDIIIVTGQSTPWNEYDLSQFNYIREYIETEKVYALGICGGHQLFAMLWGGAVDLVKEASCDKSKGYSGCYKIKGFVDVEIIGDRLGLFAGYPDKTIFYASHCEEIKRVPEEFMVLAKHILVKNYAIKHKLLPVYGVQFHPELPANNPEQGRAVIDNFLKLAGCDIGE
ncbi:MAG TPA: gamma-glutamyl-gamma-aminobutyrate hydrolase family protein [Spirochaetota bacterium]|nr:gamma-glutamyl-gamma-aminobutyrate hydrolase family protein [Spirochaetota bacterium]